jgi:hypothetical protein
MIILFYFVAIFHHLKKIKFYIGNSWLLFFLLQKNSTIAYNSKECFKIFHFHILNIAKFG